MHNGGECLKKNILEGDNKDLRRVVLITKKGYYGWRMTTLMARRRSAKRISWWSMVCESLVCMRNPKRILKNGPIMWFRSFKWRNIPQNWNLRKKLSKIDPVENFDFWSKVNAKVDKQKLNLIARKVNGLQFGSDLRTCLVCVWWHQ